MKNTLILFSIFMALALIAKYTGKSPTPEGGASPPDKKSGDAEIQGRVIFGRSDPITPGLVESLRLGVPPIGIETAVGETTCVKSCTKWGNHSDGWCCVCKEYVLNCTTGGGGGTLIG